MRRINVGIAPKDGYFFQEKDGTIIRAPNSWKGVISRVVMYRRRNKLPAGNPGVEVNEQACARNPAACHDDADPVAKAALRVASLKGRALAWLAAARGRQLTFMSEELMRARAQVCAGCPAHAAIAGGCGSCKKALRESRKSVIGGRVLDERLSGCSVLGEDVGVSTWLGDSTIENPELPACCWRRKS